MNYNRMIYILIEDSVTEIPQRLQEIDSNYCILFNRKKQKFEVHRSDHAYTYCLTVPFSELDARVIDLVRQQNWQNQQTLLKEIEEHNAKLERQQAAAHRDTLDEMTKDLYRYGKSTEQEVTEVVKGVMY
jgi:hypothetical protein